MTKLSASQFGVLQTLDQFGPAKGIEVKLAPGMDGKSKTKLECHLMNVATLAKLEGEGLVTVTRGEIFRPVDATGRNGKPRRELQITISDKGRAALAAEMGV